MRVDSTVNGIAYSDALSFNDRLGDVVYRGIVGTEYTFIFGDVPFQVGLRYEFDLGSFETEMGDDPQLDFKHANFMGRWRFRSRGDVGELRGPVDAPVGPMEFILCSESVETAHGPSAADRPASMSCTRSPTTIVRDGSSARAITMPGLSSAMLHRGLAEAERPLENRPRSCPATTASK